MMALNIKDPEADRLARQLAAKTGETLTETVIAGIWGHTLADSVQ